MPRLEIADMKIAMTKAHKKQLSSWYENLLLSERMQLQNQTFEPSGPWDAKTVRDIELRTFDAECESRKQAFENSLTRIPGAYFDLLDQMTKTDAAFSEAAVKNLLDEGDPVSYDTLHDAFRNGNHEMLRSVMEQMVTGVFHIRDPHEKSVAYEERNYDLSPIGPIEEMEIEVLDEKLHGTSMTLSDIQYTDKDRAVTLKKEIARLEKAEKDRVETRKNDQKGAKGYYQIHLREMEDRLSADQRKALDKRYSEYEKENKKLDAAKDSYFKAKLERDKLRAKLDIFGALSTREQKKLQEYEKKTVNALVNREMVKDQMLRDFDAKLERAGQDRESPHNEMRRAQIMKGETRYVPLENEEETRNVYVGIVERTELSAREPVPEPTVPQRVQLDLSAQVSAPTQTQVTRATEEPVQTITRDIEDPIV